MKNQSHEYVKQARVSLWVKLMITKLRDQIDWSKTRKCSSEEVRNGILLRKLAELRYVERRGHRQNRFWTLSKAALTCPESGKLMQEHEPYVLKEMTTITYHARASSTDVLPDDKLEEMVEALLPKALHVCWFCHQGLFNLKRASGDALRIALTPKGRRAFYIEQNTALGELKVFGETGWELSWLW